jgi:hypothetical protein
MAKETHMSTTEAEIKAVAKAVKASLTRDGHTVPHTAVLKALSAALNKRDWQTLKASLSTNTITNPPEVLETSPLASYDNKTLFWVRLAYLAGKPLKLLPKEASVAKSEAMAAAGTSHDGVLRWGGWNLPATLEYVSSKVDAGDFSPDKPATAGLLKLQYLQGAVEFEVGFTKDQGWYLSSKGAAGFYEQLEQLVPNDKILGALALLSGTVLEGPPVSAKFWSDDYAFEKEFDARLALMSTSDKNLEAIISVGYGGDYSTDNLVEPMVELDSDIKNAFVYIGATQMGRGPIGFEVRVDAEEFLRWMDACRRPLLAKILCERQGVELTKSSDEADCGRWNWQYSSLGEGSETSMESEAEAAMDAYHHLGLLGREIAENV